MDSETEIFRRYADLTMLIRPDKRHARLFDILIEFKFVSLKDAGVTGEEARALSGEKLYSMPCIRQELKNADKQICGDGATLEKKYGNLRLKKFIVVSLGFERVCFKVIKKQEIPG